MNHSSRFKRVAIVGNVYDACEAVNVLYKGEPLKAGRVTRLMLKDGKRGELDGGISLHTDGKGGNAFNWTTSEMAIWFDDYSQKLSRSERYTRAIQSDLRASERAYRDAIEARASRELASAIWRNCRPVTGHPYLTMKHIKPTQTMREIDACALNELMNAHGIRNDDGEMWRTDLHGRLLVFQLMRGDELVSLQFIGKDKRGDLRKRFMKTGSTKGAFWLSGSALKYEHAKTIGIAEGVATAYSVELVRGFPCVSAMNCGNLKAVAEFFASEFPDKEIVILSDVGNGEAQAQEAGKAISARVEKPIFTPELIEAFKSATGGDKPTDFNDYYISTGELKL